MASLLARFVRVDRMRTQRSTWAWGPPLMAAFDACTHLGQSSLCTYCPIPLPIMSTYATSKRNYISTFGKVTTSNFKELWSLLLILYVYLRQSQTNANCFTDIQNVWVLRATNQKPIKCLKFVTFLLETIKLSRKCGFWNRNTSKMDGPDRHWASSWRCICLSPSENWTHSQRLLIASIEKVLIGVHSPITAPIVCKLLSLPLPDRLTYRNLMQQFLIIRMKLLWKWYFQIKCQNVSMNRKFMRYRP